MSGNRDWSKASRAAQERVAEAAELANTESDLKRRESLAAKGVVAITELRPSVLTTSCSAGPAKRCGQPR
jgi:multidrug resistance efflux pump